MTEKEYFKKLGEIRASRKNEILVAVNCKLPKEKAGLKTEVEKMFYERSWKDAVAHEKKYGFWPTFEMCEIDYDDPCLDIYNSPPTRK